MRKFWKIFSIIFVVVFLISISTCIVLSIGSTTVTTFTSNEKSRRETFYRAYNKLANAEVITIKSTSPYTGNDLNYKTEATITCTAQTDEGVKNYECKMISKLLNDSSKVVRTSYFPGDGYQYTVENQTQTKKKYPNTSLTTYFANLYTGATMQLNFLAYDNQTIKNYSIVYRTDVTFDINSFSLEKDINVSYKTAESEVNFRLGFNKNDYLNEVYYKQTNSTINIRYKKARLSFPDTFAGFEEIKEG